MALCAAAGCGGAHGEAAEPSAGGTEVVFDHRVEWPLALEGVAVTLDDRAVHDTPDAVREPPPRVLASPPLGRGAHRVGVKLTVSRPCIPGGPRERLTVRASRTVELDGRETPIGIVLTGAEAGLDVRIGTGRPSDRGDGTVVATTTDGCGLLGSPRGDG